MNRKQKIIVSVTGIFLVLLVLVGLTYAFFLTRIRGNNNPTSISVTTANLELVYEDEDNGDIIGKNMIIEPNSNTPIGEKTFTVTNNGNATIENYGVVIENLAVKYVATTDEVTAGEVTSLVNGEDGNPDMKLVITCESSVEGKTCNGMNGFLPEKSGILLTNSIEEDEVQTYKATLTYLEDGTNQSDDMNKTIEGRFNIIDTNNTVDIEGTVTGYIKGDFVQINSEEKESVIYPDGTYKFVGVKPDNHKITVRYRENGEEKLRGTAPTENISVVKGDSAGVEGNVITITDLSRTIKVDVNATTNAPTINNSVKDYNPFNEGTLAYNIYMNAARNSNGTKLTSDNLAPIIINYNNDITRILHRNERLFLDSNGIGSGLYSSWSPGSTEEEAKNWHDGYETYKEYEGKYVSDISMAISDVFYVENYNEETDEVTVKIKYDINSYLSYTQDDDGVSYYYRGATEDNYVNFANMCWRIIRINGDESIRLLLEDKDSLCETAKGEYNISTSNGNSLTNYSFNNFGYDSGTYSNGFVNNGTPNYLNPTVGTDNALVNAFKYFQNNSLKGYTSYLKSGNWCLSEVTSISDKNQNPTLECTGTKLTHFSDETEMYVATMSANELIYAGNSSDSYYSSRYWIMNNTNLSMDNYTFVLAKDSVYGYNIDDSGLSEVYPGNARPAINLRKGISSTGNGTKNDPYEIQLIEG